MSGFPEVYRMQKCRKCRFNCRPCLTLEEAESILADDKRRMFNGDSLCQECYKKSNASQNKRTFKKAGRDFEDYGMSEIELLQRELESQKALLAKLMLEQV